MSFREVLKQSAAIVHETMGRKVVVRYATPSPDLSTTCRIHLGKLLENGDPSNGGFATMVERTPTAVFMGKMVLPKNTLLVLDETAYRIESTLPYDGTRTTVNVVPLNADLIRRAGLDPDLPYGGLVWQV